MTQKILVVDDSSDLRGMLKLFLEMEGFEVLLAKDGTEALGHLKQGNIPSLILLDMIMDGMNGKVFLEHLRVDHSEIANQVPIIAMSAMEEDPEVEVSGFLTKPFNMDELTKAVHLHCEPAAS